MLSFLTSWFSKKNKESMDKNSDFPILMHGQQIIFSLVDFDGAIEYTDRNAKISVPAFVTALRHIKKIKHLARGEELDAFLKIYHDKIKDCNIIIALGNHDRTGRGYTFEEGEKRLVPTGDYIFPAAKCTKQGLIKDVYLWGNGLPPKGTLYLVVC